MRRMSFVNDDTRAALIFVPVACVVLVMFMVAIMLKPETAAGIPRSTFGLLAALHLATVALLAWMLYIGWKLFRGVQDATGLLEELVYETEHEPDERNIFLRIVRKGASGLDAQTKYLDALPRQVDQTLRPSETYRITEHLAAQQRKFWRLHRRVKACGIPLPPSIEECLMVGLPKDRGNGVRLVAGTER